MPLDSYVDWGAVHFYTPLNRTGEQILTDEEINGAMDKIIDFVQKKNGAELRK